MLRTAEERRKGWGASFNKLGPTLRKRFWQWMWYTSILAYEFNIELTGTTYLFG